MKTLLLLRHAKSDWGDENLKDFDRPLAPRGERDAPRIGKALLEHHVIPDRILSSPALRTRQTTELIIAAASLSVAPTFMDSMYGASADKLMGLIESLPDDVECTLLVGHNPGMEELVSKLASSAYSMPTAALACFDLDISHWEDADSSAATLAWIVTPKHLNSDSD